MFSTSSNCCISLTKGEWPLYKVAVVGTGRSGMAAARLLHSLGAYIRIVDKSIENVSENFMNWIRKTGCEAMFGEHCPKQFEDIDIIILSPGVPLNFLKPYFPTKYNVQVLSETELAWYELSDEKVLAITGTNGKTTITSLCAAMLVEQGISIFVGGNIGIPLSEYILSREKVDVVVLELSSFQLQTCSLFRPDIAIFSNISINHLDYHRDMNEYISAKLNICKNQNKNDLIIIKSEIESLIASYNLKAKMIFYKDSGKFSTNRLLGAHNRENAEAAWLACKELGVTEKIATQVIATFEPLEHRLEQVKFLNGVLYVNDSKGTTVEALRVALESFEQPILLLAGGKFKGGDLTSLRTIVKKRVRMVGLFGNSRECFENAWGDLLPMTWDNTLEQAVKRLSSLAHNGEVVLLAPATSSFDQYSSYIERGNDFKRIVCEVLE